MIGASAGIQRARCVHPAPLLTSSRVAQSRAEGSPCPAYEDTVLRWLLVGSVPGILFASRYTVKLPELTIRGGLGGILILSGAKLLLPTWRYANWMLGIGIGALAIVLTAYTVVALRAPRTAPERA